MLFTHKKSILLIHVYVYMHYISLLIMKDVFILNILNILIYKISPTFLYLGDTIL